MNKLNDKAIAEAAYYICKKISPVSAAGKLLAINLAAATNAALKTKTKTPLRKI